MNKTSSYFAGKPYSEFPVRVDQRPFQKTSIRNRNPGLINIYRSIDMDKYQNYQKQSQSSLIRKLGDRYQKKLQKMYEKNQINKNSQFSLIKKNQRNQSSSHTNRNQQQGLKSWYHQRIQTLQGYYQQYMSKIQKQLCQNQLNTEQRVELLNQMNKSWQQQIPLKLKKCFQE